MERKRKVDIRCKVDTGAQSNALPLRMYRKMYPETLKEDGYPVDGALEKIGTVLTGYGGYQVKHLGIIKLPCRYKERKFMCPFYVTDEEGPPILGLRYSKRLGLITINCVIKTENQKSEVQQTSTSSPYIPPSTPLAKRPEIKSKSDLITMYPECFGGIGCFKNFKYHITLDPEVKPVIHPPRRVPIEVREKLKAELDEMETSNIIGRVYEPTTWVSSYVSQEHRNGDLRVCLDPKDLNTAVMRDHYPTPTLEEIMPKLAGSKLYSKLDAKKGYWNIELDEESTYLTTFNTPFGRYRYFRVPFGLKVSQDVFQYKIDETYQGCQGAIGIADDIVVYGKDDQDHDLNLHEAMERTRQAGLKLNQEKCMIKDRKCSFYGFECTNEGMKPDPAKVEAIKVLSPPEDKKALHTFLGMITYLGPFIPSLSSLTEPLRRLLRADVEFQWSASHTKAFNDIKSLVSNETTLTYYNRHKPLTLQVDSSTKGIGAVLVQEGKPIAYASKAMTDTETRYANIERELLAVVYGCQKFHTYLYGRKFLVESDHKPLEQIAKKNLTKAPPRLQRMLLRLQPYNMEIRYKPGKQMVLADALSRLNPLEKKEVSGMHVTIHSIVPVSPTKLEEIRAETAKDSTLQVLKGQITSGWPESIKKVQEAIKPYWSIRQDISVQDGIMMMGQRIIIPKTLQDSVLGKIHEGHLGIEKCQLRAKSCVYWLGIYSDIKELVLKCETCQKYQCSQQKEELIPMEVPPRPWHTLGADFFHCNGIWWLIVSDYYSKFPLVKPMKSTTAASTITVVKQMFSEHGIPERIICDNGSQFVSEEFRQFSADYGFAVETSSPYYPKGHGFIERQVETIKKTLVKCKENNSDPYLALLILRSTPLTHKLCSPAELLAGRQFKSTLPIKIPEPARLEQERETLKQHQEHQRQYYDQHGKNLPELFPEQPVYIQNVKDKTWRRGKVVRHSDTPRSYVVTTADNPDKEFRRNRVFLRPVPATPPSTIRNTSTSEVPPPGPPVLPPSMPDPMTITRNKTPTVPDSVQTARSHKETVDTDTDSVPKNHRKSNRQTKKPNRLIESKD
jgi:transposase InsO family protein